MAKFHTHYTTLWYSGVYMKMALYVNEQDNRIGLDRWMHEVVLGNAVAEYILLLTFSRLGLQTSELCVSDRGRVAFGSKFVRE